MSKTVAQIFAINPVTTILNNDLFYLVNSPYTPGTDAAISGVSLKALFLQPSNNLSDLSNVSTARTNLGLTAIATAVPPLSGTLGGTGINNGASLITIGGSFTLSGAFSFTGTLTNTTTVTFPTSGTLATTSQLPTPSALTSSNDTNVTITLGGTPATSLLQTVSLTMGWTGQLGLTRGGTNASLVASNGGIIYSTASAFAVLAGTASARQMLQSGSSTTPAWSTSTWPATTTANQILFSSATNTVSEIIAAASSVLITSAGSVPSLSQTLPSAVQGNITSLGTITSGVWNGTTIDVPHGGTNNTTFTAYSVICAGTTATGAFQNVSSVGSSGQVLTSNGAAALPTWQNAAGTGTVNSGTINQLAWYAATGTAVSGLATANNGTLITSAGGVPSISSTLPAAVQGNIISLGTITSGTWNGSLIDLVHGGSNANLTASNGGIVWSNASQMQILAGTATANQVLLSGSTSTPAWSTATYPATTTINQILYSSSANVIAGISSVNSAVLSTNGSGVPSFSTTLPSGIAATNMVLTTPNCGTPSAINLSNATSLASAALPAGTLFNTQSTNTTTVSTTSSASMANISGVTVTITPTSSSNKILVRATIQTSATSTAAGYFQLARGGSAIGVGAASGSRTTCGAASIGLSGTAAMQTVVMEFLDAPATTSATTYTAQFAADGAVGTVSVNASNTDTNTSAFPRTSSTITVHEVHA